MPPRPDAPLRKVTLNLYEADCKVLEAVHGHGWTVHVRDLVHADARPQLRDRHPRTLGDLSNDPTYDDDQDGNSRIQLVCKTCGLKRHPKCDGEGWLEPIGPKSDGSYITSRRCYNAR